jgi:hypothetical protein
MGTHGMNPLLYMDLMAFKLSCMPLIIMFFLIKK